MKQILKISALAAVVMLAGCNSDKPATTAEVKLDTLEQKAAYAMGASLGNFANQTLKQQEELGLPTDRELVKQGFIDALASNSKLSEEEIGKVLREHEQKMIPILEKKAQEQMEQDRKASEDYLKKNAEKDGVITTESGLQYAVVEAGKGKKPALTDTVTVHYTGTLIDGTVFDSSVERGQPTTFPLGNVIQGWQEGLQLMPEGSKYQLTIPADLAYGDRPVGNIPPGSVLVFEVELLSIGNPEQAVQ
ncbi:MAG: FKBP-type peptidyl-prolyl cis-trans isomerase [Endozoicomonas sp.]